MAEKRGQRGNAAYSRYCGKLMLVTKVCQSPQTAHLHAAQLYHIRKACFQPVYSEKLQQLKVL